ncbi:NADH-quinone oxidoreductase subunit E [Alphaproteobacteria bacterium GH1-50]|uniref:NADH-quinone oxidoreductase subunit E n=1 Tax=Kangsaoukella pontilimi TaxID=2691042 RepID=A0A7C9MCS0_9RHOB|nr:NADH-quinone oxidoreductase subunit E [Kangsaoukella pontilimi]MXQ07771.1 NADH-quinone oxidoreductase subunit E [Kangsaoukella pontilimi]
MLRRLHPEQPDSFEFTEANRKWAEAQISKYPEGRQASAIIPLLWRAQEQEGWLSRPAMEHVAAMLDMAYIRVLEVATFYFMFQLQPVGSVAHIQVCGTTSCMICGAEDLIGVCKDKIAANAHELSADGKFSWEEVECLGSCSNAPMAQIGKDYYEDLTADRMAEILDELAAGKVPTPGPQNGRFASEPLSGLTSLEDGETGHTKHNASVQLAVDIGDTVKRIDGTEVPLRAPWREAGTADPNQVAAARDDLMPPEGPDGKQGGRVAGEAPADRDVGASSDKSGEVPGEGAGVEAKAKPPAGEKPAPLDGPRDGAADDLKKISGVGPKLEALLNSLGVYHFDQVAGWSEAEIAWVDENLEGFKGRVTRDEWVRQAKELSAKSDT